MNGSGFVATKGYFVRLTRNGALRNSGRGDALRSDGREVASGNGGRWVASGNGGRGEVRKADQFVILAPSS